MARMDLKTRRDAPGMSVFWMILIVGAGVSLLLAIVLISANGTEQLADDHQVIVAGEDDDLPGTASFGDDEVADEAPQEPGDLPGEAGELDEDVQAADEAGDTQEGGGTTGAVEVEPAPVDDAQIVEEEADVQESEPAEEGTFDEDSPAGDDIEEITPSGPEGRDDEVIIE